MNAIETNGLTKFYQDKTRKESNGVVEALKSCTFAIPSGSRVGFVGLNGAGKSTTIKLLAGIMSPTRGEARVLGLDPFKQRKLLTKRIGVLFGQRSNLVYDLPLKHSFDLLRTVFGVSDVDYTSTYKLINDYLDLDELINVPVRKMSLGQRMRCEVASVLLHSPELLFFDEAFLGIDMYTKRRLRDFLEVINAEKGTTLFITSHDIKDIERFTKSVIVIDDGNVLLQDEIKHLLNRSKTVRLKVEIEDETQPDVFIRLGFAVEEQDTESNTFELSTTREGYKDKINALSNALSVISIIMIENGLEDIIDSIYSETRKKDA